MKTQNRRAVRKGKMTDEQLEAVNRKIRKTLLSIDLRELRKVAGKTQVEVAEVLKMSQGQVSLTERREDHLLSTLRRYVEALGGELKVVADFGDRQYRLHA